MPAGNRRVLDLHHRLMEVGIERLADRLDAGDAMALQHRQQLALGGLHADDDVLHRRIEIGRHGASRRAAEIVGDRQQVARRSARCRTCVPSRRPAGRGGACSVPRPRRAGSLSFSSAFSACSPSTTRWSVSDGGFGVAVERHLFRGAVGVVSAGHPLSLTKVVSLGGLHLGTTAARVNPPHLRGRRRLRPPPAAR